MNRPPADPNLRAPAPLIDSHCHLLALAEQGLAPAAALARARAAGVERVVTIADGIDEGQRSVALADQHPGLFVAIGWEPRAPAPPDDRQLAALADLLTHPRAVAVGEVGLDYHRPPGGRVVPDEIQRATLRAMLDLAGRAGKPVVVHDRLAHDAVLEELDARPPVGVVMHCFSGGPALVRACAERGFVCSFAGTVTFRNAGELREAVQAVPAGLLAVETDAPFLAPEPHRGRRNEPALLPATLALVAALRGECADTVARAATATVEAVFRLPPL